jgi:hypothetical protein
LLQWQQMAEVWELIRISVVNITILRLAFESTGILAAW